MGTRPRIPGRAGFRAALPGTGGNVANTISGTVWGGPVLMGRDFGDITIGGGQDDQPAG